MGGASTDFAFEGRTLPRLATELLGTTAENLRQSPAIDNIEAPAVIRDWMPCSGQ
jgi:hypothetical protein